MAKSDFASHHSFRVRWSETDAQGVVFNARYLDYGDVAVTEYWREIARTGHPIDMVPCHVKKATVEFLKPVMPDELISVMCRTLHVGSSSMRNIVEIHGGDEGDDLRASIEYVVVHVDLETHKPVPLPDWVRSALSAFDALAKNPIK